MDALIGIGHADQTGNPAVDGHEHHRLPLTAQRSRACCSNPSSGTSRSSRRRWLPRATLPPVHASGHALARHRPELLDRRRGSGHAARPRPRWRRPADARCRARGSRPAVGSRLRTTRSAAITDVSAGFPSVRVPVLSTTSVSTFSSVSSASAFLTRTPAVAPRPVPTMMDIGVARPSAQGHAMISTATAFTSAYAIRGSGPTRPQMIAVTTATATTAGTK